MRYFNPIGAHNNGLIGENPIKNENNIIPIINKVAAGIIDELLIYGNNWDTFDGTGIRDYIHVVDLAEGHIAVLNYLLQEKPQILTLNLGTGKGTSVLELIQNFEKINNVKVPFSFGERRLGDNGFIVADNSLASSLLNWMPKRSLEEMCIDGWNWKKNNLNGF